MKKLTTAILGAALVSGFVACRKEIHSGPVIVETRTLQSFSGIDLKTNGTVYYKKDTVSKVEITAKEGLIGVLETKVVNGNLVIGYKNGKDYDSDESVRIDVSGSDLGSITLNKSGSIYCLTDLVTPVLYLRTSGSGNIQLKQVFTGSIDAASTMSGHITATGGNTFSEKLKTDASGKIDFSTVAAKNVDARIIGSGDIRVKVSDKLDATIGGSGSIFFSGYPMITTDISGTGRLVHF